VHSIATLDDLAGFLAARSELAQQLQAVNRYRELYGVSE
jgi:hypothetical protein